MKSSFAIIPAAGRSLRMGTAHKLLLPWQGKTVIEQVLAAWCTSHVTHVPIVVRKDDTALQAVVAGRAQVEMVLPAVDPGDMKRSIQAGLSWVQTEFSPSDDARWLTAPADMPTLRTEHINQVLCGSMNSSEIVLPRFGDRRGHPVSLPWSRVPAFFELAENQGLNSLLDQASLAYIDLPARQRSEDIDTPSDYQRLLRRYSNLDGDAQKK